MNTPVTFEIAKLLKGLGFNEPCYSTFNSTQIDRISTYTTPINHGNDLSIKPLEVLRPTVADVVMWLYEKHDIWVWVEQYGKDTTFMPQIPKANLQYILGYYNTPHESYEAAFKYIIKKIIN